MHKIKHDNFFDFQMDAMPTAYWHLYEYVTVLNAIVSMLS